MSKTDQRRRRKAGFEVVSPTVIKDKFVAWLIWEEVLAKDDLVGTAGEVRDRIIRALETYLATRDMLPDIENEPNPAYATDHPWQELEALRDRPPATQLMEFGVLELDRPKWQRRPNSTPYLMTRRTAAIREIDGDTGQHLRPSRHRRVEIVPLEDPYDRDWHEAAAVDLHPQADDYDPEDDIEEASADLSDEAIEEAYKEDDED